MSLVEQANAFLWVEKYRPSDISDVILPERIRTECLSYVKDGQIPHMILGGSAGIGKTTVAKALAKMIDADLLYINASNESGVDTIRTKIIQFASTASFEGNLKTVLLDECLHEDEKVRIGKIDNWKPIPLKDLEIGVEYDVVSMNLETGELENDTGSIISDRFDEVFEVELEDGRIVRANARHPFFVMEDGKIVEKELQHLKEGELILTINSDDSRSEVRIKSIKSIGVHKIRNLTVTKNHSFVTENGIPTHNCDQLSHQAQGVLRAVMEEFHAGTRFILTCNFKNKLMDAIQSRCISVDFLTTKEEKVELCVAAYKRCCEILKNENVEYDKKTVASIVQRYFPDMRRVLNALQKASASGRIDATSVSESLPTDSLYDMMRNKKFGDVRKWVAQNADDYQSVFRDIYDRMSDLFQGPSIPNVILIIDQYQDRITRTADAEITLMACLIEIMSSAEWKDV